MHMYMIVLVRTCTVHVVSGAHAVPVSQMSPAFNRFCPRAQRQPGSCSGACHLKLNSSVNVLEGKKGQLVNNLGLKERAFFSIWT